MLDCPHGAPRVKRNYMERYFFNLKSTAHSVFFVLFFFFHSGNSPSILATRSSACNSSGPFFFIKPVEAISSPFSYPRINGERSGGVFSPTISFFLF